jgi:hypothetical protein
MEITTRKEASEKELKWFFTGEACKHGHIDKRLVSNGGCYACSKERYYKWHSNNKELRSENFKQWANANKDKRSSYMKTYLKSWKQKNSGKVNATAVSRKKWITLRTPSWADLEKIEEIYIKSSHVSKETGILHHVDHIVPLQNKLVCGLHVEWNLQIITAEENLRKNNKFEII